MSLGSVSQHTARREVTRAGCGENVVAYAWLRLIAAGARERLPKTSASVGGASSSGACFPRISSQ